MNKEELAKKIYNILGLEVDPDGEDNMILLRDEFGNVENGISYEDELNEIVNLIEENYISKEKLNQNIGMLRQYLNERVSKDLITNKELETFLNN